MRKKMMPVLVAVVFVIVISLIVIGTVFIQRYIPTKEESDLQTYYQIQEEDDLSIVLDHVITGQVCKLRDGHAYLTYEFVKGQLNSRFYWDSNENILRYTTPDSLISVNAGDSRYTEKKETKTED
jgi:hypothetical protein